MCGIAGYIGPDASARHGVHQALDALAHRGPDDRGTHLSGNCAMGMTRLSVMDIDSGHQPMYSRDLSTSVVFNGEIYNYKEIRTRLVRSGHSFQTSSDTEVLVHLYEECGREMVDQLRGMFAFAIHDARTGILTLARDRFGKKPLYYTQMGEQLWFGSEIKAVAPWVRRAGYPVSVDPQAVYDYLSLGVVPQPSTIFADVRALPPATTAEFSGDRLSTEQYWAPSFEPKTELEPRAVVELTRQHVRDAVQIRLGSDVPLGVFLSGGVDSSVIAFEAAQIVGDTLETFTIATGDGLDESVMAKETARFLGVRNTALPLNVDPVAGVHRVVEHYDQPYADSSAIASMQVAALAGEHVSVVLNGDGGDELFAGYRRHIAVRRLQHFHSVPPAAARCVASVLGHFPGGRRSVIGLGSRFARGLSLTPEERYLTFTTDMLGEADKQQCWRGPSAMATERLVTAHHELGLSSLDQQILNDVRLNLLSDLLVKMDIACMASSVEGRSPFMDHILAEFAFRLPDTLRVGPRGRGKCVLRDAYRGLVPDRVLNGAKKGFEVPMERWLGTELRPLINDVLGGSDARVSSFVDDTARRDLLANRNFSDRNRPYILYSLLVLELWLRREEKAWV